MAIPLYTGSVLFVAPEYGYVFHMGVKLVLIIKWERGRQPQRSLSAPHDSA